MWTRVKETSSVDSEQKLPLRPKPSFLTWEKQCPPRPMVHNLWVATQNWVVRNKQMGQENFIKITLLFIFDDS